MRSYWRNYFEKTDALIWVVDATDRLRIGDCREELAGLLLEEVSFTKPEFHTTDLLKRLMGASLLVFSNKTDVGGYMSDDEIRHVDDPQRIFLRTWLTVVGASIGRHQDAQMDHRSM